MKINIFALQINKKCDFEYHQGEYMSMQIRQFYVQIIVLLSIMILGCGSKKVSEEPKTKELAEMQQTTTEKQSTSLNENSDISMEIKN